MHIEDWSIVGFPTDAYTPPEWVSHHVKGIIYSSDKFADGSSIRTSAIIEADSELRRVVTKNGSIYTLGKINSKYAEAYADAENRFWNSYKEKQ